MFCSSCRIGAVPLTPLAGTGCAFCKICTETITGMAEHLSAKMTDAQILEHICSRFAARSDEMIGTIPSKETNP